MNKNNKGHPMMRRDFIGKGAVGLTALGFSPTLINGLLAKTGSSAGHANIVLVLMDNFGYGEVGVYGGGVLRGAATPNIDSLASEGFRLTNYNVETECVPSRAALMTGRYGIRTRL
jgi:arylsulfatase